MMRPWKLAETNYAYVKEHPYEVAVLPLGRPSRTICICRTAPTVRGRRGRRADLRGGPRRGAKVVLLPTIPYGTETNQMAFPLAMNVNPSTLFAVIRDLVDSLAQHGIRKIVLLNSHGGNDLKPLLRELYGKTPAAAVPLQLVRRDWPTSQREIFASRDDHAGEMETSLGLAYFPHLVARNADGSLAADEGAFAPTRFEAVNRGWVSITRPWHLLTTNSGAGNPHAATAEKAAV